MKKRKASLNLNSNLTRLSEVQLRDSCLALTTTINPSSTDIDAEISKTRRQVSVSSHSDKLHSVDEGDEFNVTTLDSFIDIVSSSDEDSVQNTLKAFPYSISSWSSSQVL